MAEGSDEQDLVKALDNVAGAAAASSVSPPSGQYVSAADPQPGAGAVASPFPPITVSPLPQPTTPPYLNPDPVGPIPLSVNSAYGDPIQVAPQAPAPAPILEESGPLASIKQDALFELRPLVDKLNVSPEEKFDTYLLLIRSTDDTNLIGPAHEAAKAIADETRRAEALLDIIKEIDFLSHPKADA